ncbi:beta-1,4-glucuronyltransferase 1-like [Fopius arisanus]|uniref:Beta-1,4-glucuronyltransferase 1-like n=1 Tax=Fopius arisanus TaxID=64838 RepID=A0A9R1TAQ3_9HYME|nr:PREDICTED: beta-1,4-glucuronyltransferase 1-like [Fopius arisanus]
MRGISRRLLYLLFLVIFLLLGTRLLTSRSLLVPPDTDLSVITQRRGENARIAPAYAPGVYMAGRRPANSTFCNWNYGLPRILRYTASKITRSPQNTDRSPYRVLPFIIRGGTSESNEIPVKLTLCTHATADQVYNVVEIVRRWEGHVSLSIFTPGLDAGLALDLIERACTCEPQMFKVSVHLIFPAGRPPALTHIYRPEGDCAASDLQWRDSDTERKQRGMIYPINVARNVARNLAPTSRVLVSDIELLPSDKLASGFLEMIHGRPPRFGLVFVVPVFEIEENERPPKTKRELMDALRSGLAVYFHKYVCAHCQKFPGITKWMVRPDPGRVRPLIVTKREYPHHRWEPVFIGTREDPLYNEEMSWEGRQDKMAQMLEMCLMDYRLIILDGAFLIHTPGIKRKPSRVRKKESQKTLELTQEKRNARIYQSVTRELLKQYPANRRCRQ